MDACTAVLDVGKTHARVCLVDADGAVIATRRRENRVLSGPPYDHLDVDGLFVWICDALSELGRDAPVAAIVPVTHGAAAALVDDSGLVLPVLDYESELPHLALAEHDPCETFSPDLPAGLNLASQLAWLQDRHREAFARALHLLPYPQYWAFRLGGRAVSEVTSLGCHTHLWAPWERRVSSLARARGWDALLPPLVPAWECVGTLSEAIAARTGLPATCRLHAGIHDSNASFLVHRAGRDGPFAVVSSGTWVVVMAHGADRGRLRLERDMLANVDAFGDPVPTMRFMGGREYAALAGDRGLRTTPRVSDVRALLDAGLVLASDPAPTSDAAPRATDGPSRAPAPPLARAAFASLRAALRIDECLDALGAAGDVIVEGPMALNAAIVAMLACLRPGQRVLASSDVTGTTRGAAMLAHGGRLGVTPELTEVAATRLAGLDLQRAAWRAQAK